MVELAIALGIAVNLLITEVSGVSAAGLVVPGYLALHFDQPGRLAATFLVAILTYVVVRFGLARLVVLYGRRRLAAAVLVGFVLNALAAHLLVLAPLPSLDLTVIGHIVPGLIANEAMSQRLVPTVATTLLAAAIVRVILLAVLAWPL